ncbi:MAG: acylphosphatase [Candidatus Eisenbacteria bacterium]|uniref:Acylphosphatase n=1 Tax=Eiseniibacteriota bacterium TaxID=2212470 RepID=A0A948W582_UNCEI|nr:acylphosphatase [Candidatus Eisenbacteria bacterium]MBU1947260.1 acylphosphatase [Candidatus Eisenbacteria bacterium]MBU2693022.1 acylphosphatase [Candidatus Eisenbacteria bacterium]
MRQFHAIVTGRVQGVCFRMETRDRGLELNLAGYAKNLPDGSVEVVARGEQSRLQEFITYLQEGPRLANVEAVKVTWDTCDEAPNPFTILY